MKLYHSNAYPRFFYRPVPAEDVRSGDHCPLDQDHFSYHRIINDTNSRLRIGYSAFSNSQLCILR